MFSESTQSQSWWIIWSGQSKSCINTWTFCHNSILTKNIVLTCDNIYQWPQHLTSQNEFTIHRLQLTVHRELWNKNNIIGIKSSWVKAIQPTIDSRWRTCPRLPVHHCLQLTQLKWCDFVIHTTSRFGLTRCISCLTTATPC